MSLVLISLGGGIGALCRYFIAYVIPMSSFWAIIFVNALGSFIIGYLFKQAGSQFWIFSVIGFCGAFTTFSTYSMDTIKLLQNGDFRQLLAYILLMNGVSIFMCWLGVALSKS